MHLKGKRQFKKYLRHDKVAKYYSNGEIKYERDWINDKFIGN